MNDEALNLALGIYSNPGVYAILLGSGISRSAAIPTGWEIVTDLVSKLKTLSEDSSDTDLITWYKEKYGEEPDYSRILEMVSPTQAERNAILRSYFEPSEEEREQQLKIPTAGLRYLEIWTESESDINRDFGYCAGLFRILSVVVRDDSFMVSVRHISKLTA